MSQHATTHAADSAEPAGGAVAPAQEVPVEDVDLLVAGGGKAGKSLAMLRAKSGDTVVMV